MQHGGAAHMECQGFPALLRQLSLLFQLLRAESAAGVVGAEKRPPPLLRWRPPVRWAHRQLWLEVTVQSRCQWEKFAEISARVRPFVSGASHCERTAPSNATAAA